MLKDNQRLVKWNGKDIEEATLMNVSDFQGQFPYFSLGDKADLQQGENYKESGPKTMSLKVYSRRAKRQSKNLTAAGNLAAFSMESGENDSWQELVITEVQQTAYKGELEKGRGPLVICDWGFL